MLKRFFQDEKGQGAIEYIMLVSGVLLSAIIVVVVYNHTVIKAGDRLEVSVNATASAESEAIATQLGGF